MPLRYRYPFIHTENAEWVRREVQGAVERLGGSVEVQGRHLFVALPEAVAPAAIEPLPFFEPDLTEAWAPLSPKSRPTG